MTGHLFLYRFYRRNNVSRPQARAWVAIYVKAVCQLSQSNWKTNDE